MQYKNLILIGTSHISKQSIKEIKESVEKYDPVMIAIELDRQRLHSLMNEDKNQKINYRSIWKVGIKGFLFAVIAKWVSDKLGKKVGIAPGSDMKTAVMEAHKRKLPIALIDQDIRITLRRLKISWRERWRFVEEFFYGIFFRKKQMKNYGLDKFDLTKVPEDEVIETMIGAMQKRYPGIYKALISERNIVMSMKLIKLMKSNPDRNIIAVVGAGHKKGMLEILKDKWDKVEIVKPVPKQSE